MPRWVAVDTMTRSVLDVIDCATMDARPPVDRVRSWVYAARPSTTVNNASRWPHPRLPRSVCACASPLDSGQWADG